MQALTFVRVASMTNDIGVVHGSRTIELLDATLKEILLMSIVLVMSVRYGSDV